MGEAKANTGLTLRVPRYLTRPAEAYPTRSPQLNDVALEPPPSVPSCDDRTSKESESSSPIHNTKALTSPADAPPQTPTPSPTLRNPTPTTRLVPLTPSACSTMAQHTQPRQDICDKTHNSISPRPSLFRGRSYQNNSTRHTLCNTRLK